MRRSATREQAWRIFQQHRNAFIRSRINSSNWGTGHVRFGHSYSFAAGYVCILLAALARIHLAQFSHVKSAAGALALHGLWRFVSEPLLTRLIRPSAQAQSLYRLALRSLDKFVSQLASLNVIAIIQIKIIAAMSSIQFWNSIPAMSNSPVKNCATASIPATFTRRSG